MTTIRKVTVAKAAGSDLEFVLSDATVDRYGDVIEPDGWELSQFRKNPIALFNHRGDAPIGRWTNVRVTDDRLVGKLQFADEGTSPRIDEIRSLVEQGILRAVSVGFRPLASEPLDNEGGRRYVEQELLEVSLVSIPANPNAIQLAKSMNISGATMRLVFGEHADRDEVSITRRFPGEHAESPPPRKTRNMTPIGKRIEDAQQRLVALRDQLTDHLSKMDDANPNEADTAVTDELNGKIDAQQKALDALKQAEQRLALSSEPADGKADGSNGQSNVVIRNVRPFAAPAKKVRPGEYVLRTLTAQLLAKYRYDGAKPASEVLRLEYGDDEPTRAAFELVTRAAVSPATTTTSGWAAELVQTVIADFMDLLTPQSVYPGLSARGQRFTFGRNGIISIPSRSATPTIAGSFVAQGAPIPVRKAALTAVTLTPKKMAVISTFTREIAEHSTPAIEQIIRNAMQEDTAISLDTVLLDATAASTTRPAGIRNGVTVTAATAGGGFAALVGDIKALVGALITSTNGNLRNPVWIMNPVQQIAIALTQNAGGDFPFAAEINNNRLQSYPVIVSATVPAGMVILVDAADFVSVTGDEPNFNVSDTATIHEEDTTPLAIGTAGAPNTVAAPVRSLWQTDSIGIRMIMDVNWALRRTGVVAWTESVTW